MGEKIFKYAWTNGHKTFLSVWWNGVKNALAEDLICMGDIEIPYKDKKKALKNPAKYLTTHGWKWIKLKKPINSWSI